MEALEIQKLAITQLIAYYLELENSSSILEPKKPTIKKAYTFDEWQAYSNEIKAYNEKYKEFSEASRNYDDNFRTTKQALLDFIPVPHVWFITPDKKYAFARQHSDWPMDPPKILIRKNPIVDDLPELKLQIVN